MTFSMKLSNKYENNFVKHIDKTDTMCYNIDTVKKEVNIMNDNIKVTAEYTVRPNTEFDAYLEELRIIKAKNEQNRAEKTPIINAIGREKFNAIHEQLKPIEEGMLSYMDIVGKNDLKITVFYGNLDESREFTVRYCNNQFSVYISRYSYPFNKYDGNSRDQMFYLEHWNEYGFIEKLSDKLKQLINAAIMNEKRGIDEVNKHLADIQK